MLATVDSVDETTLLACKTRGVQVLILRRMSYRREPIDVRTVVSQPSRSDLRTELPGRIAPLPHPVRIARDLAPPSFASEAPGHGSPVEVILVKSGFKQVATRVPDILYVESARNYVRIHQENGPVLKTRVPIERFAQHLGTERFIRIHRGRLVNIERIRSVRPLAGGRLQLMLSNGSTTIVARDRRRVVLAQISSAGQRRV